MNFCPNCGTKIEDPKIGCPDCGLKPSEYSAGKEERQKLKANEEINPQKEAAHGMPQKAKQDIPKVKGKREKYDYYENRSYDTYNYGGGQQADNTENALPLYAKILLIIMVVFLNIFGAVAGAIIGAVLMRRNETLYKSFGKKLLIISVIFIGIDIFIWKIILATLTNLML